MSKMHQAPPNQSLQPTAGRSHDAVIRVYDEAGNVIEAHEHTGEFKERAIAQLDGREAGSYPH